MAGSKQTDNPTEGWAALTYAEVITLYRMEGQLTQVVTDAQAAESAFYEARTAAFVAFETQKQSEFVALQNTWQVKEDGGFII